MTSPVVRARSQTGQRYRPLGATRLLAHGDATLKDDGFKPTDPPPGLHQRRVKAERQLNAALTIHASGDRGVTMTALRLVPRYTDSPTYDAFEKKLDRDRRELRSMGADIQYRMPYHYVGESYVTKLSPPPVPEGKEERPAVRYLNILYCVEKGYRPTVAQLAEYLGVSEDTIREDLEAMCMCCSGPLPHQYLDAREEDGVVVITGPKLYA